MSVDITQDATLLAVSTISEVKLFSLSPEGTTLRIRKIDAPPQVSSIGARIIKFSPDQKWLCVVTASSHINIYKVLVNTAALNLTQVLPKARTLRRLRREPLPTKIESGSLGQYERTVHRLVFSEDSRILAVTDLSGYFDTWVLKGHEETAQDVNIDAESSRSSSDNDTSHSEQEDSTAVILGQKWIRNPSATLLPRLPAAALVISFRPSSKTTNESATNHVTALHPTINDSHPYPDLLPDGEDRLLVVTAANQVFEFHVVAGGRLTPWSRRNPIQSFPSRFRDLRDPAKGVVWDISTSQERVWLYGATWLWMFDLAQDMSPSTSGPTVTTQPKQIQSQPNGHISPVQSPPPTTLALSHALKRKRSPAPASRQRLHPDSGAGSLIPTSHLSTGLGDRTLTRIDGDMDEPGRQRTRVINLQQGLMRRKRAGSNGTASGSEDDNDDVDGQDNVDVDINHTNHTAQSNQDRPSNNTIPPATWHTLKYRPILGIVSLGPASASASASASQDQNHKQQHSTNNGTENVDIMDVDGAGDRIAAVDADADMNNGRLEVVLVERPMWDAELPDRFVGKRDR